MNDAQTVTETAQQRQIREAAEQLAALLDQVVPGNVAHWAVEETRRTMSALGRAAHTIHTADWYAARQQ